MGSISCAFPTPITTCCRRAWARWRNRWPSCARSVYWWTATRKATCCRFSPSRLSYAMFLLARFRETRACPLLVRIFSAPGETAFDLIGETVTEDLCSILASVSGGDLSGMRALIENEQANEYVRPAAMKGLLTLVATGQCTRDEVMEYFASLFGKLERTPGHTWNALASCCTRLGPEEVLEPIQRAFEDELVEPFMLQWRDVEEAASLGSEGVIERLRRQGFHLISDVVKEMEWWACLDRKSVV